MSKTTYPTQEEELQALALRLEQVEARVAELEAALSWWEADSTAATVRIQQQTLERERNEARAQAAQLREACQAALYLLGRDSDRQSIGEKPWQGDATRVLDVLRAALSAAPARYAAYLAALDYYNNPSDENYEAWQEELLCQKRPGEVNNEVSTMPPRCK